MLARKQDYYGRIYNSAFAESITLDGWKNLILSLYTLMYVSNKGQGKLNAKSILNIFSALNYNLDRSHSNWYVKM